MDDQRRVRDLWRPLRQPGREPRALCGQIERRDSARPFDQHTKRRCTVDDSVGALRGTPPLRPAAANHGHAPGPTEPPGPEAPLLFSEIRDLIVWGAVHPASDGEYENVLRVRPVLRRR